MGCNEHSNAKVGNIVHRCEELKASLWLRHTSEYNYVNAYNLAVMSTLAYSRVDPNKTGNGVVETGDVADFYKKCAKKMKFSITNKEYGGATAVKPLFRYAKPTKKEDPLIEPNQEEWFVDTDEKNGNSTEAFFFVDDENAVLSVRGTAQMWTDGVLIDGDAAPVQIEGISGYFHRGFAEQAKTIMYNEGFEKFLPKAKSKKLFITGHSLGGAVATILAAYLKEQGCDPVLYTYGSPRVGNEGFVKAYSAITHYRHVYHRDPVPMIPTKRLFLSTHDMLNTSLLQTSFTTYAVISRYLNPEVGDYLHHGTLCQIAKVGSENMILPFESHGIVGDYVYEMLTQKLTAKKALILEREPEEYIMENGGTQAQQYLLEKQKNIDLSNISITDGIKDGPMVGDLDLVDVQDAYGKIRFSTSATDHFMKESYLPFFEKEIKRLWSIYENNGCKEIQWYASKRYDMALKSIEEKIKILKEKSVEAKQYNPSSHRTHKIRQMFHKQIHDLEAAKQEVLSYKQKKIGTKALYSLYTGDPELNTQLGTF